VRALLAASHVLGESRYSGFVAGLFSAWLGRGGPDGFEDHVAPVYELLELYERTRNPKLLDRAVALATLHHRFDTSLGVALHRPDLPGFGRQIWVDCMHIDGPFLARLGRITGDAAYFDLAAGAVLSYARKLQQANGLFSHGWEEICGSNGQLWARGNGWALTGMLDTIRELPHDHPGRPELEQRVERLLKGLEFVQHTSGLWHTILEDDESYLEASLAAMVAFAISGMPAHDGMRRAAEAAVLRNSSDDGVLQLVTEATPVGEKRFYATRRFGVYPWGQGPLVLLLCRIAERT
jgi:rhamnogalacturonyl hydrolase YesR